LDLYLVRTRNNRYSLSSPPAVIAELEGQAADNIQRSIAWLIRSEYRIVAWLGRVLRSAHGYYVRLEDRIDPVERVLKAMAAAEDFVIFHPPPCEESKSAHQFKSLLRWQRIKHIFWFIIDIGVCGVVVVFTPFLAPIPGPNVFFYYPFLRLLSHYRALRGVGRGLYSNGIQFKCLPE
jgi:hypothetical protein